MKNSARLATRASAVLALLLGNAAALAGVTAEMQISSSGVVPLVYNSNAAVPNNLSMGGTSATLQFGATPGCTSFACQIDGPAVGAYLAPNGAFGVYSMLRYSLHISGPSAMVPVFVSGRYSVVNPLTFPEDIGGTVATSVVDIRTAGSRLLYGFQSLCNDFSADSHELAPEQNCGTGLFSGSFFAAAGSDAFVYMNADIHRILDDAAPASASAFIDPYFQIDPVWAAAHPGYSLSFDPGVGNGVPGAFGVTTPVPEPETYALFLAGMAALAIRRRRITRPARP